MIAPRCRVAVAVVTLTLGSVASANAEFEEVEYYTSLDQMTRASDVVVLGRVVDAHPTGGEPATDPSPACEGYAATLAIESVLTGRMTPTDASVVMVEWFFGTCDLPQIEALQVDSRAILFLRNRGVELRQHRPDAAEAEIEEASRHWRTVIYAATVVDESGVVRVPDALNAPFLAELDGSSFEALVSRLAAIGSSMPDTATVEPGRPAVIGAFGFVLLGCLTALVVFAWPPRRVRD